MCAIGLNGHIFAGIVQARHKRVIHKQGWLATRKDNMSRRVGRNGLHYVRCRHRAEGSMVGVAERTRQIAAGETDENGRGARVEALALQGVENLVYGICIHGRKRDSEVTRSLILDIDSDVALALLETHLVAVGNLLANVSGKVLGRGIEVHQLIEETMVQGLLHLFLDDGEIRDHAIGIQLRRAAVDCDYAVVAVKPRALALVVEIETMCESYLYTFGNIIHNERILMKTETLPYPPAATRVDQREHDLLAGAVGKLHVQEHHSHTVGQGVAGGPGGEDATTGKPFLVQELLHHVHKLGMLAAVHETGLLHVVDILAGMATG